MAETLTRTEDGRNRLSMVRRFRHAPETVWRAITRPEHLAAWFPFDVELELVAGGRMTFLDKEGGPSFSGTVLETDPPRVFAFDWEGELIRFELQPDGDGTIMTFTHDFDDRYGAGSFGAGWTACFAGLAAVLDGVPVMEPDDMAGVHDELAARFGLDAGQPQDDGTVRFERQLTRSDAAYWQVLAGDRDLQVGDELTLATTGTITAIDVPDQLELKTADGPVTLRLGIGTGQGGRLHLTVPGDEPAWREWITGLAARLRELPPRP
ncbi:SRPBCC family protein [Pseudonocardiaceae bacterium YIM PH 21723]|nr:SRPBCC family protein [Pseudonocardiaceae bacterium YIM PH 21723]